MNTHHKIIFGDSRKMTSIKDESVQLVVTSPPYWHLKDYENENQIGFNQSYEEYINNLNMVWSECYRVLNKGCRLCINIGDQFARAVYYGRYKVIPIRTEIIKFCESLGLDYMGAIIWQKVTTSNTTGGAAVMGSFPNPRNGILKIDYEFILIFKKLGDAPKVSKETKSASSLTKEEWNEYFSGHWNFAGAKQDNHIAMFPEELPKRLIKMFTFVNETVLDPFLGSGTTSLAAKNLDRNSIGYEINAEFKSIIKEKLHINEKDLFNEYQFIEEEKSEIDFESFKQDAPYFFIDNHNFKSKIDQKKLQYGSKIDFKESKREDYFSVKEIIAPNKLRLNNDLTVRLIGIKEKIEINGKAIDFLSKLTKGSKIFLRYDEKKHDSENNLLCYVYLKNKTFINAHLLKNNLAEVDETFNFKYLQKFRQLTYNSHV